MDGEVWEILLHSTVGRRERWEDRLGDGGGGGDRQGGYWVGGIGRTGGWGTGGRAGEGTGGVTRGGRTGVGQGSESG